MNPPLRDIRTVLASALNCGRSMRTIHLRRISLKSTGLSRPVGSKVARTDLALAHVLLSTPIQAIGQSASMIFCISMYKAARFWVSAVDRACLSRASYRALDHRDQLYSL